MKLCQIIRLEFCFICDNSIPIINLQQQLITDCGFTTILRKNAISYLFQINFQIVMDSLTFTLFELLWFIHGAPFISLQLWFVNLCNFFHSNITKRVSRDSLGCKLCTKAKIYRNYWTHIIISINLVTEGRNCSRANDVF